MTAEITSQSLGVQSHGPSLVQHRHKFWRRADESKRRKRRAQEMRAERRASKCLQAAGIRWPSVCVYVYERQKSPSATGNNFSQTESPVSILRSARLAIHSTFQPLAAAITHFPPPAASQPEPSSESSHCCSLPAAVQSHHHTIRKHASQNPLPLLLQLEQAAVPAIQTRERNLADLSIDGQAAPPGERITSPCWHTCRLSSPGTAPVVTPCPSVLISPSHSSPPAAASRLIRAPFAYPDCNVFFRFVFFNCTPLPFPREENEPSEKQLGETLFPAPV